MCSRACLLDWTNYCQYWCDTSVPAVTSGCSGAMLVTSGGSGARHHQYWSAIVRTASLRCYSLHYHSMKCGTVQLQSSAGRIKCWSRKQTGPWDEYIARLCGAIAPDKSALDLRLQFIAMWHWSACLADIGGSINRGLGTMSMELPEQYIASAIRELPWQYILRPFQMGWKC